MSTRPAFDENDPLTRIEDMSLDRLTADFLRMNNRYSADKLYEFDDCMLFLQQIRRFKIAFGKSFWADWGF